MRICSNLPEELWPEIWQTATYLIGITPQKSNQWRSPKEALERWFRTYFRWYQASNRPFENIDLHPAGVVCGYTVYGCKAYPLAAKFKANPRSLHFKLNPHAHIGYLVGYKASNLLRIWIPALRQIMTARDVIFDERTHFDATKESAESLQVSEYIPPREVISVPDIEPLDQFLLEFEDALAKSAEPEKHLQ
jgi:hypothetical protein